MLYQMGSNGRGCIPVGSGRTRCRYRNILLYSCQLGIQGCPCHSTGPEDKVLGLSFQLGSRYLKTENFEVCNMNKFKLCCGVLDFLYFFSFFLHLVSSEVVFV